MSDAALQVLAALVLAGAAVAVLVGLRGPQRRAADVLSRRARGGGAARVGGVASTLPRKRLPAWPLRSAAGLGGVAGACGLLLDGPVLAVLSAGGAVLLVRAAGRRSRQAAEQQERERAVEACLALAAELRAGRSPADALDEAAGVASGATALALQRGAGAAALGGDVAAALLAGDRSGDRSALLAGDRSGDRAADRSADPRLLRALAACWEICASAGTGLATAVDRLADGLAADRDARRALEAELAGPRATAGLLAVLPLAGIGLAASLGADPLRVLLHTPLGVACLAGGILLDLLGLVWTRRLVEHALRA
jgi:tight adherence protein B